MIGVKAGISRAKLEQLLGPGSELAADNCRLYIEMTLARQYAHANLQVTWCTGNAILGPISVKTDADDDWYEGEAIGAGIDYAMTAALCEAIRNYKGKSFG